MASKWLTTALEPKGVKTLPHVGDSMLRSKGSLTSAVVVKMEYIAEKACRGKKARRKGQMETM